MHTRQIIPILASLLVLVLVQSTLFEVAAAPVLQTAGGTPTPSEGTETPTAPPAFSTIAPVATQELAPSAEILADGWQMPFNLSKSGASTDPQMVVDSNGRTHVLWSDDIDGFVYAGGSNDEWSAPRIVELPFFTRQYFPDLDEEAQTPQFTPLLVADRNGFIHAFWIDDDIDLYHSKVAATAFTDIASWTPREMLGNAVMTVAADVDDSGRLHMAYIRTSETDSRPAGIYYRQIAPSGTWSDPILLYSSRYLRAVKAEEANIQILAPDSVNVSIVWDDTIREQVYFAHSADNGLNWNAPLEIDRRGAQDIAGSAGPSFVDVGRADEVLILTWSAGHELDQLCNQYASISRDGGATWTTRQPLPALPGCFVSTQFIPTDSALLLLGQSATKQTAGASVEPTTYLLAWDGSRWSDPQIQEALATFTNLDTNQAVNLQCQQALGEASSIRLLGCDANDGRDIWITGREAGDIEEWFPPPPVWQGPQQVSGDESDPAEVKLLAAADGNTYVLWYEENGTDIFQSGWDGQNWTAGRVVVTAQQGNIASLSVASGGGQIYRAWEDSNSGLQFSTADTTSPFAWSAPYALMPDNLAASAPALVADAGGNVFLAYAVQLNEERGIYLLHSADAGETWSEPRQIFDGSAAQWDMVDWPFLARTDNGQLHLVWTQRSLPPDGMPLALAYSNSDDLGRTWSEMEVFAEVNSSWSRIMGGGERTVHRLWSEDSLGRSIIWHQASLDGGLTWSQSQQVAVLTSDSTPATTIDTAQRPHLLAIDSGRLSDSVWNGATWENDEGLDTPFANGGSLDATADNMGRLIMSFVGLLSGESAQETSSRLFALHRVLDLPDGLPAVLPTIIPTPALIVPTATVAPQPTATVFFSTEREPGGIDTIPGLPIGTNLIFGIIPALIIVAIGLFVGIRIVRK